MDSNITRLSKKVWDLYETSDPNSRILIGIAGIPGSGKTTLALNVATALNSLYEKHTRSQSKTFAADLPMDGFHYTRAHLAAMPNPATAIHRRGAAFTFDADGFYTLVTRLRNPITSDSAAIYAPSFDHAVKDPVENGIAVLPETKIVVFEGNYVCLDREPWKSAAQLMNELWFVDVDREVARERLVKRHVASGICPDEEAARERIRSTDFLNADDIVENRLPVNEVVKCG
ncbi:phosphoribulokinase/uridine kinase [Xylariales sp. PMI_506]|nr:phosphoribulokinase/uridine kinase [Xylariales sp. PMI_506]